MVACVFCGEKVNKSHRTMEHVLPRWLLEATGGLHRKIRIGSDLRTGVEWIRPASTFEFPACGPCNESYGRKLETQAKKIIESIAQGRSISVSNVYRLLDWLDKVRIGLWLGFAMLHKESDFIPKFSISTRLGRKDRVAIVAVDPGDHQQCLIFGGTDNNLFRLSQCAMFLRINNIRIISISGDCLISEETGLPHGEDSYLVSGKPGFTGTHLRPGAYELAKSWPVFEALGGTVLAQPIIDARYYDSSWALNLFANSRVLRHTKDIFQASGIEQFLRLIPLQLISDEGGEFRYYGNKRERLRVDRPAINDDAAFMRQLYGLMLARSLRSFPKDIKLPSGEIVAWPKGWRTYLDCLFQVMSRLAQLGIEVPGVDELVNDIQKMDRLIEEIEAHSQGTCVREEPLIAYDQFILTYP